METSSQDNLKITFRNSFLEYFIALIAFKPLTFILGIILIIVADGLGFGNSLDEDIMNLSNILSLLILVFLATKVVRNKLKKKQEKMNIKAGNN